MSDTIFRKAALRRLNTPDQLDHLMQVLHWRGWVVLAACMALVLAALAWSLFGTIKLCAQGRGMLLHSDGVSATESAGGGQVCRIDVQSGSLVRAGQQLGLITNPALTQQILQSEAELEAAQQKERKLRAFYAQYLTRGEANTEKNAEHIRFRIAFLGEHQKFLQERLDAYKLPKSGGATREEEMQNVRVQLDETLSSLNECHFQLLNLVNQLEQQRGEAEKTILDSEVAVQSLNKKLASLRGMYKDMTEIRSPVAGQVLEVCVENGSVLAAGGQFAIVGRQEGVPEAVVLLKAETGRKVRPGMRAFVYPSTVVKEEFGGITGEVVEVSDYLVSMEGLGKLLNNEIMARKIIEEQGALVSARIRLGRDPKGALIWSSSNGPQTTVNAGTLCEARIVVEERHPVDMVIPHLLGMFGLQ